MKKKIELQNIYSAAAAGDAAGTAVTGLKPEAIQAFYKNFTDYVDPTPHLKNKLHKWIKKGYYSYITQMNLITTYFLLTEHFSERNYQNYLKHFSQADLEFFTGIFRNPSPDFRKCLSSFPIISQTRPADFPSAMVLPFALFYKDERKMTDAVLRFASLFSVHPLTSLSALTTAFALKSAGRDSLLIEIKNKLDQYKEDISAHFSRVGFLFTTDFHSLISEMLLRLSDPDVSQKEGLQYIVQTANHYSPQQITKPSHAFPLASVMTSLFLCSQTKSTETETLFSIARLGGEANIITAIAGMVLAYRNHLVLSQDALNGLANYKQIILYGQSMERRRLDSRIKDPYKMEYGLTKSVSLELNKLFKKQPQKKPKKTKEQKQQEKTMIMPTLPEKSDKRKWREYERKKSKEKKQRRKFGL